MEKLPPTFSASPFHKKESLLPLLAISAAWLHGYILAVTLPLHRLHHLHHRCNSWYCQNVQTHPFLFFLVLYLIILKTPSIFSYFLRFCRPRSGRWIYSAYSVRWSQAWDKPSLHPPSIRIVRFHHPRFVQECLLHCFLSPIPRYPSCFRFNKEVTVEIGRAHVWTPVTPISRMPSSAWKKN